MWQLGFAIPVYRKPVYRYTGQFPNTETENIPKPKKNVCRNRKIPKPVSDHNTEIPASKTGIRYF